MKNTNIKINEWNEVNEKTRRWIENDPQSEMFDRDGNYIPKEERKRKEVEA